MEEKKDILDKKFLTVSQVAEFLGVTEHTIRNLCNQGDIKYYRVGRVMKIEEQDFQMYLEKIKQN